MTPPLSAWCAGEPEDLLNRDDVALNATVPVNFRRRLIQGEEEPKTSATVAPRSDRRWNLDPFHAVGQAYDDFTQATDDEVRALL